KCFITVSVGMVRASRCHRLNMKTYIINGSEVSRLSVAIHYPFFDIWPALEEVLDENGSEAIVML
ncbi:hypothetical protein, partial [Enterobacter intestinihominis]|uniref:hypothetical protein n=1 Tax=Enterobacter intestinihominis TaxID=3133180 RepID=UPI003B42DB86